MRDAASPRLKIAFHRGMLGLRKPRSRWQSCWILQRQHACHPCLLHPLRMVEEQINPSRGISSNIQKEKQLPCQAPIYCSLCTIEIIMASCISSRELTSSVNKRLYH